MSDSRERFCGEWLVMCGGAGLLGWRMWNIWKVFGVMDRR